MQTTRGISLSHALSGLGMDPHDWPPAPALVTLGAIIIPYLLAYLLFIPNTRLLRIALLPIGWICAVRVCLGAALGPWREGDPLKGRGTAGNTAMNIVMYSIIFHASASTQYAFSREPPEFQEPPQKPYIYNLRKYNAFKALNLVLDQERQVTRMSSSKLRPGRRYVHAVLYHLCMTIWYFVLLDAFTYTAFRLAPSTLGSPDFIPCSYRSEEARLAQEWNVPNTAVRLIFTLLAGGASYVGMVLTWHMVALCFVGSGLWVDGECPRWAYRPWLATSLIDLWGTRWHQLHKRMFLYFTAPVARLGVYVRFVAVFVMSAIFHSFMFAPQNTTFPLTPNLKFFGSCGLGCALERAFFAATGRKVQGWPGRIWTWCFIFWAVEPLCTHLYDIGWPGSMRGTFVDDPRLSLVEAAVSWVEGQRTGREIL